MNFGFVSLALKTRAPADDLQQSIELLSVKMGLVLLVLGAMHFFNMRMLHKLGRRATARVGGGAPSPLTRTAEPVTVRGAV